MLSQSPIPDHLMNVWFEGGSTDFRLIIENRVEKDDI
jgi:hypothetical protein